MGIDRPGDAAEPAKAVEQPDVSAVSEDARDRGGRWVDGQTEIDFARVNAIEARPVEGGRTPATGDQPTTAGGSTEIVTTPIDVPNVRLINPVHRIDIPGGRAYLGWADLGDKGPASQLAEIPGHYTTALHGDKEGFSEYSVTELAQSIRDDPAWSGQPVVLFSCETGRGEHPVAQDLANELGTTVYAPTEYVWIDSSGSYVVAASKTETIDGHVAIRPGDPGWWRSFTPQGHQPSGA